jgi:hypothetical protein
MGNRDEAARGANATAQKFTGRGDDTDARRADTRRMDRNPSFTPETPVERLERRSAK